MNASMWANARYKVQAAICFYGRYGTVIPSGTWCTCVSYQEKIKYVF